MTLIFLGIRSVNLDERLSLDELNRFLQNLKQNNMIGQVGNKGIVSNKVVLISTAFFVAFLVSLFIFA